MPQHPLSETFGFPADNFSDSAIRHREKKLCPFNNKVPNCTKDKATDPLGTCSIFDGTGIPVVTCPIRFREEWIIADHAASFFFPPDASWTSLTEVRLNDAYGQSAGNIDLVLVQYDEHQKVVDFGSVEVQAVYISGNVRRPFEYYMADPATRYEMDWTKQQNYPRPDFLSSSRKRLAPQLIFKGGILKAWSKKQAVVVDRAFWATLPKLPEVPPDQADMVWLIYDLVHDVTTNQYHLTLLRSVYTEFKPSLDKLTTPTPGSVEGFIDVLQEKLDSKIGGVVEAPPDAPTLFDLFSERREE
jgi:hypothetical protein